MSLVIVAVLLLALSVRAETSTVAQTTPAPGVSADVADNFETVLSTCYKEGKDANGSWIRKCRVGMQCLVESVDDQGEHRPALFTKTDGEKLKARFENAKKALEADIAKAKAANDQIDTRAKAEWEKVAEREKDAKEAICAKFTKDDAVCLPAENVLPFLLACNLVAAPAKCTKFKYANNHADCAAVDCEKSIEDFKTLAEQFKKITDASKEAKGSIVRQALALKGNLLKLAVERLQRFRAKAESWIQELKKTVKSRLDGLDDDQKAKLAAWRTKVKALADECKAAREKDGSWPEKCKKLHLVRRHILRKLAFWWKVSIGVRCVRRAKKVVRLAKAINYCDCEAADKTACLRTLHDVVAEKTAQFCENKKESCTEKVKNFVRHVRVSVKEMNTNEDGECLVNADITIPEIDVDMDVTDDLPEKRNILEDSNAALSFLEDALQDESFGDISIEEDAIDNVPEEEFVECDADANVPGLCTDAAEHDDNVVGFTTPVIKPDTKVTGEQSTTSAKNGEPMESTDDGSAASTIVASIALMLVALLF